MELCKLTARELSKILRKKEVSAVDIVKSHFSRIKDTDEKVGAYITLTENMALSTAARVDEKIKNGEKISDLAGIPISVKDLICVKGVKNTCASKMLENFVPYYDATVIKKINENDIPILGKVNMDEFALGNTCDTSALKKTCNPFDLERVAGGSSGGSGASVAADEATMSLGTDTGGSVRNPASYCGIVGLKPTYGAVSRYGAVALASSLDQIGPMAKTVEDAGLLFNAIAGFDENDAMSVKRDHDALSDINLPVKGLKIGLPKEFFGDGVMQSVKENILAAAKFYESNGAHVEEISIPSIPYSLCAYYILSSAEASSNLAKFDGIATGKAPKYFDDLFDYYLKARSEGFGMEVKRRIMLGTYVLSSGYYDAYYKRAQIVAKLIRRDFIKAFESNDVLLTPATPTVAPKSGDFGDDPVKAYMADICTVSVNIASLPAISIPCGYVDNMPVGMQLIGNHFNEKTLIRCANYFEQANDLRLSAVKEV